MPLTAEFVRQLVDGVRDRALVLVGFAAVLRRSELAALNVGDVAFIEGRGVEVHRRRSKPTRWRARPLRGGPRGALHTAARVVR